MEAAEGSDFTSGMVRDFEAHGNSNFGHSDDVLGVQLRRTTNTYRRHLMHKLYDKEFSHIMRVKREVFLYDNGVQYIRARRSAATPLGGSPGE
jgi:glucan phosphorylase